MSQKEKSIYKRCAEKGKSAYRYCTRGVWNVENDGKHHKVVKSINLAVRCFFNREVQERACALTFRSVLAIVPLLAMLFAVARGFGFQNIVHGQLLDYFPSQQQALKTATEYVDNYLEHTNQGAFLGVGLVMLIYTLVMLMGNVERAFNKMWGIEQGRPFYRKVTDYTAMFVFIPVLMVCSAGVSVFLSETVQEAIPSGLSPVVQTLLGCVPYVVACMVFTSAFWLIPYTKVKFRYALISGIIFGSLSFLLQWLFVSGQVYVSKYNAIYGSFAFLPLMLVWMQLSWMLLLMGASMTYSLQNVFGFNYSYHVEVKDISSGYLDEITILSLALVIKRFEQGELPLTRNDLAGDEYNIPILLADRIIDRLHRAGLVACVSTADGDSGYQPAFDPGQMTLDAVKQRLAALGNSRFITAIDERFAQSYEQMATAPGHTLVRDLLK